MPSGGGAIWWVLFAFPKKLLAPAGPALPGASSWGFFVFGA